MVLYCGYVHVVVGSARKRPGSARKRLEVLRSVKKCQETPVSARKCQETGKVRLCQATGGRADVVGRGRKR